MKKLPNTLAWAFYDWANSAFALCTLSVFFPLAFNEYWAAPLDRVERTFHLGWIHALGALLVAILAPLTGALVDRTGKKRAYLFCFTLLGALATFLMGLLSDAARHEAMLLILLAGIGFGVGITINDSQLTDLAPSQHLHKISAWGFALGYLGGGLALSVLILMVTFASQLHLTERDVVFFSFSFVGCWWFLFSMPSTLSLQDPSPQTADSFFSSPLRVFHSSFQTMQDIFKDSTLKLFLLSYFLYMDGVGTLIRMSVDYGKNLGMDSKTLVLAVLLTQLVAVPSTLFLGYLGTRTSVQRTLIVSLLFYGLLTFGAFFMSEPAHFYFFAVGIGLVQGGVQSLSRSLFGMQIPEEKKCEYFGFFTLFGRFAAVLGPLLMGGVALVTESTRYSILAVLPLFLGGAWILGKIRLEPMPE